MKFFAHWVWSFCHQWRKAHGCFCDISLIFPVVKESLAILHLDKVVIVEKVSVRLQFHLPAQIILIFSPVQDWSIVRNPWWTGAVSSSLQYPIWRCRMWRSTREHTSSYLDTGKTKQYRYHLFIHDYVWCLLIKNFFFNFSEPVEFGVLTDIAYKASNILARRRTNKNQETRNKIPVCALM